MEAEKMAALGGLVAGVAHKINTPVGIGVTMASLINDETEKIVTVIKTGKIKVKDINHYLSRVQHSSQLILDNLLHASDLVQSLKQVAVEQSNLQQETLAIKPYLQQIVASFSSMLNEADLNIMIGSDEQIKLNTYPGALWQIMSNLMLNSITHGYQKKKRVNYS